MTDHVEPTADGAGQADEPETEPVAAPFAGDLDQAALQQHRQQPGRGGLVDVDGRGDLGHPGLAVPARRYSSALTARSTDCTAESRTGASLLTAQP